MSVRPDDVIALAKAIWMLFAQRVDVVVHSLETETIDDIANPFSQRKPDDPWNMQEVAEWCAHRGLYLNQLDRGTRRPLINDLHVSNALTERNAAAYVARLLGVNRAKVYNDLKASTA